MSDTQVPAHWTLRLFGEGDPSSNFLISQIDNSCETTLSTFVPILSMTPNACGILWFNECEPESVNWRRNNSNGLMLILASDGHMPKNKQDEFRKVLS